MAKKSSILYRILKWFGLIGEHKVEPGKVLPFWFNTSKSKYLAISIPVYLAGIALLFFMVNEGLYWGISAVISGQFVALAMLLSERLTIKVNRKLLDEIEKAHKRRL